MGAGVFDMLKEAKLHAHPIMFGKKLDAAIKDTCKEAMYKNLKFLLERQKSEPQKVLLLLIVQC
ncbi:hypothetical protein CCP3SC1AL1_2110008 [Gammaproteobacteria bacterium]